MEDNHPNKQSGSELPKEQTVDESQPEQLVGVLQSVGEALQYEKWLQRPIETKQTVKTAAERKRKSRSEKERRLLEKGGVKLLQEYKRRVQTKATPAYRKKKKI